MKYLMECIEAAAVVLCATLLLGAAFWLLAALGGGQ